MPLRAHGPLARSAVDRIEDVEREWVVGPRPGDMRRAEEGEHGDVEGRCEMARAGVGRHQERRAADAGLRESEAQRLTGQADDARMIGLRDDRHRRLALGGAAEHQDVDGRLDGEAACERREVLGGPRLGRPEGATVVEADDARARRDPQVGERTVGGALVIGRCVEIGTRGVDRTTEASGQCQVVIDDRRRSVSTMPIARGFEAIGQEQRSAAACVADPAPRTGPPGEPGRCGTNSASGRPSRRARRGASRRRREDGAVGFFAR